MDNHQEENIFVEFSNEPIFHCHIPELGFRLIQVGEDISLKEFEKDKFETYKAVSRQDKKDHATFKGSLLMPLSPRLKGKRLSPPGKDPLFQRFADLVSEEEILIFANEYGALDLGYYPQVTGEGTVKLESLAFWKKEILEMKGVIEAVGCFENRGPVEKFIYGLQGPSPDRSNLSFYPFRDDKYDELKKQIGNIFPLRTRAGLCLPKNEPLHFALLRGIAAFCSLKLRLHQCNPAYGILSGGRPIAYIKPRTLAAALWLEFAQSFFKDGPEHKIARRCFHCGRYGLEGMHQRKKEPNAGLWYHETCKCAFYNRKRRRKEREQREKEMESKKQK